MKYSITTPDVVCSIKLEGDMLAPHHYEDLLDAIDELILNGTNLFAINLEKLRFMNSSGLAALCMILTRARKADGEVMLSNVPEHLSRLLIVSKLSQIFSITTTEEEAIASLKKNALVESKAEE